MKCFCLAYKEIKVSALAVVEWKVHTFSNTDPIDIYFAQFVILVKPILHIVCEFIGIIGLINYLLVFLILMLSNNNEVLSCSKVLATLQFTYFISGLSNNALVITCRRACDCFLMNSWQLCLAHDLLKECLLSCAFFAVMYCP